MGSAQRRGARWTIQLNDRFYACPEDMHVRRTVIIWIDHYPQPAKSPNRGHGRFYQKPKRLGK